MNPLKHIYLVLWLIPVFCLTVTMKIFSKKISVLKFPQHSINMNAVRVPYEKEQGEI